tara:strand:+ start:2598 stop:2744 length:147 start_codon:yes stop_codon:yes gene_type:complete
MKKKQTIFLFWLAAVLLWNFGFPNANPAADVIVAVALSLLVTIINNKL